MTIMRRFALCLALALVLMGQPQHATALDPRLEVSQYGHRAWRNRDGFARTNAYIFAQTPDGYLWLGSGLGLTRFDGVENKPWRPPAGASLPDVRIGTLFVARDGTLWIGTLGGLASWDGRKFSTYPAFRGHVVGALAQDHDGVVWAAGGANNAGFLCAIRGATTKCFGKDGSLGPMLGPLQVGRDGSLWVGAINGLWRWTPERTRKFYSLPNPKWANRAAYLHFPGKIVSETAEGAILVVTPQGIRQIVNGEVKPYRDNSELPSADLHRLFNDRDGALWIGTNDAGLLHLHQGRVDSFGPADGLAGDKVHKIFEDREGNVWVATRMGIDRFTELSAVTYSSRQGLTGSASSVLAAKDGSIWINTDAGLHRWRDGRMFVYRARGQPARRGPRAPSSQDAIAKEVIVPGLPQPGVASLFQDRRGRIWIGARSVFGYLENDRFTVVDGIPDGYVDSMTEDSSGDLWIAKRDIGALRLSSDLAVHVVPSTGPLKTGHWWRLTADPVHGGVWMGASSGGVVHFANERIQEYYSAADGLAKGAINDLRVSPDGSTWVATDGGVSRIRDGHISTLDSKTGLPCDEASSTMGESDGSIWVYGSCGLARITQRDLDAWAAAAGRHDASRPIPVTVLDDSDGVRGRINFFGSVTPNLSRAPDGRLWFTTHEGVAVVDPLHLQTNSLPPPVHIEQIVADHKAHGPVAQLRLPPLVRDLRIDYTALSLVAPEKVRFRYRLEGRDREWQEAGNRRQAFYTDLAPGRYRFRVIAANNSGVWNNQGAMLDFSIAPAYWQAGWFKVLVAVLLAALLAGAYVVRMRGLARGRARERRQQDLRLQLAHANRLATTGQLTASIVHEISQPLSAAAINAKAAQRWLSAQPSNIEETAQSIQRIAGNAERAAGIVRRIRGLSKKATAQQMEPVSLNVVAEEVVGLAQAEAAKQRVTLRLDLDLSLPLATGDRIELSQVLLNLVVNAIEALDGTSSEPREVSIVTRRAADGGASVAVRDTGPGLDPAVAERLFEPFYTTKATGLGIGLSICRTIIETHKGNLIAGPNTPRGALFQFTLPARGGSGA